MDNFTKVIGYEPIKEELRKICDALRNRELYLNMGARLPSGVLLYGKPGLGKTLMAKCFIAECGLESFTVKKNTNDKFVDLITNTFKKAKECAPSIVFLDDMDKFANEDDEHQDADEYVAIQTAIDDARNFDVFVLATANSIWKFPDSLIRPGRFDKTINFDYPTIEDSKKIMGHYLKDKKLSSDINLDDVAKMIIYNSCAKLETVLNEAAMNAAYKRKPCIEMEDIVSSILRMLYDSPNDFIQAPESERRELAFHEAAHAVMSDILLPGSVGLVSIRSTENNSISGFIRKCRPSPKNVYDILISLAGKAASELISGICSLGCKQDVSKAYNLIKEDMTENCTTGLWLFGASRQQANSVSQPLATQSEAALYAELERYMFKTKEILAGNMEYLSKVANALSEKETLLASDIEQIRSQCDITKPGMF